MPSKILLVDDESHILTTLRLALAEENYDVETALDGEQALECLKKEKIDLIVMDVVMPGMDGMRFIHALQQSKSLASIPLIIMSALPYNELAKETHMLSNCEIIAKPFDISDLLEAVRRSIQKDSETPSSLGES